MIELHTYSLEDGAPVQAAELRISSQKDYEQLQEVFKRACNSWEKCPPEIMNLHDLIRFGAPQQNYFTMPKYVAREDLSETENQQLDQRLKRASDKQLPEPKQQLD